MTDSKEKLAAFTTRRTKIKDNEGTYCQPGDTAMLDKKTAKHYQKLGYVEIDTDTMFGGKDENSDGDTSDAESGTSAGTDDTATAGKETTPDAGKGAHKAGRRN